MPEGTVVSSKLLQLVKEIKGALCLRHGLPFFRGRSLQHLQVPRHAAIAPTSDGSVTQFRMNGT